MTEPTLEYKPDPAEAMQRMGAWWSGETTDRVVASVTAPRAGGRRAPLRGTPEEQIVDFQTVVANLEEALSCTYLSGEAFPAYWVFPAAVPLGIFLGCRPTFRDDTTWQQIDRIGT